MSLRCENCDAGLSVNFSTMFALVIRLGSIIRCTMPKRGLFAGGYPRTRVPKKAPKNVSIPRTTVFAIDLVQSPSTKRSGPATFEGERVLDVLTTTLIRLRLS